MFIEFKIERISLRINAFSSVLVSGRRLVSLVILKLNLSAESCKSRISGFQLIDSHKNVRN